MDAQGASVRENRYTRLSPSEEGCPGCRRLGRLLEAVGSYTYSVELKNGCPVATHYSPSCVALTGYTADEFAQRPFLWMEIVHPRDQAAVREQVGQVLAERVVAPLEHRIVHRDGPIRWVRNTIVSYYDAAGTRLGYDGLITDITALKQAEEHFTRLLESSPDATVIVNAGGSIVLVNKQTEALFGYNREELLGQPVEIFLPEPLRQRHAEFRCRYAQTPDAQGMSERPRLLGMHKDGRQFPVEISLAPIQSEEGLLIAAAIRDVSQRVEAEENVSQLLAAQKIQEHLLPVAPPVVPGLEIAAASYPALFASGDYFDFLPMLGGGVGFVVGDVSGHGFASALLMASTHAFLRSFALTCATISEIMTRANMFMSQAMDDDRFVTLLMARYDPRTRLFSYVNAGHPSGYVFNAAGGVRATLNSTSVPLGVLPDAVPLPGEPVVLEPGDVVILLTDGVIEAFSPTSERYGQQRLAAVVRAHIAEPARALVDAIHRSVLSFSGLPHPVDDLTVVVIKVQAA